VRGHDRKDIRRRPRAGDWLLLLAAAVALATPGPAEGQGTPVASWKGRPEDPVRLVADRVQTWEDGGHNWVLLEDRVEVGQGDVSLRADRAVARIARSGRSDGSIHRLEVYIEGDVRDPGNPGATFGEIRTRIVTTGRLGLHAREPANLHTLPGPPRALPILARAFPTPPAPGGPDTTQAPGLVPPRETSATLAPAAGAATPTSSTRPAPAPAPAPEDPEIRRAQVAVDPAFPENFSAQPELDPAPQGPVGAAPPSRRAPVPADPAFPDNFSAQPAPDPAGPGDLPPLAPNTVPLGPDAAAPDFDPPTSLAPLPDAGPRLPSSNDGTPPAPVLPGSQRVTTIYPRGLGEINLETLPVQKDGTQILVIRNGVNIQTRSPQQGIVDIEADNVVIWRRKEGREGPPRIDFNNQLVDNPNDPLEFYLEGHVIFRQDQLIYQGKSDQKTYQAERGYYDVQKDQLLALNAQLDLFSPGLVTPTKIKSPRIVQYHPLLAAANGQFFASTLPAIQAERTVTTGSRFANPGYRFTSKSIDVTQVVDNVALADNGGKPFDREDLTWQIDARQNFFFFGPVPIFYIPRLAVEADDIDPPIQGISFATNNFFGQQFRTDYDVFNLLNIRHLPEIDVFNLDVDYLSARSKKFGEGTALGSEIGWFGSDLINDIKDPFHRNKAATPSPLTSYAGYFDVYGLFDGSRDVLGGGPAVITNSPNNNYAGRANFSRISNPTFQHFRGIVTTRHMQSLVGKDAPLDEDFRVNLEIGFFSDRNFLEQYFKRRFDTGLDQENLLYLIRQKQNVAYTLQTEVNLQTFNTETQWYPKGDYYRLGDSLLGNRLTYSQHTGADYANVHTAAEVNNRTIFAFLPIDPISNTNGTFQSGRLFTTHELDAPFKFKFLRVTPYLQGQAVGWNRQITGHAVGRIWGAAGIRADFTLWKAYPNVESELLNVHGLNHKVDFVLDARDAYSNVKLNSLGVQDDLDDNAYEYSRRYFALTNYVGGVLPPQYDPRFLLLRRALSPISGPTDIQASIETVRLGVHQRLQTKRGQEGRRHINDWMILDVDTTYFPMAARDNFNKPFGQNFYNYEWYIGDRTSIVSYGWFESYKVTGNPYLAYNTSLDRNNPFGQRIITSGLSITRIPKGNIFVGYTVVNTGPINTSALNAQYSYWMSPKWFMSVAESYDFGNGLLLGASGSLTRIGADYLTSVGLAVSPLQHSYQFVFEISPRLSPNIRLGSASGLTRLDQRFAPIE